MATTTMATPFSWAQRREKVFISVILRDLTDEKFDLTPTSLTFECVSDNKKYAGTINFFDEIDVEASKQTVLGFGARIVLAKKNAEAPYWPRLTKEGGKHNNVFFDWDKYIDSDEEGEDNQKGLGKDWDPSMMQNFGGPGGPGGFGGPGGPGGFGGPGGEDSDDDEEEGHEGHDHEGHDHEGHDHEGHDHEGHECHDHEGHDHEGHGHVKDLEEEEEIPAGKHEAEKTASQ